MGKLDNVRRVRRSLRSRRCDHDYLTYMAADGRIFAHEVCRECGDSRLRQTPTLDVVRSRA